MTIAAKLQTQPGVLLYEPVSLSWDAAPEQILKDIWGQEPGVLLAHASDGLIWGCLKNGELLLAKRVHPTAGAHLRWKSLLDLRIFGPDSEKCGTELRIWRTGGALKALRMREVSATSDVGSTATALCFSASLEREYCLLGKAEPERANTQETFTILRGSGGQCHAPPSLLGAGPGGSFRIRARHYYGIDPDSGMYRLIEHRYCHPVEERTP